MVRGPALFIVVVLSLLSLAGADSLRADSWDDYKAGVEALEGGDAATAVRLLERAVADKPEESSSILRRYLPHFQLGLAKAALGDCRAAVASFEESRRQGKNTRDREADQMRAVRSRCEAILKQADEVAAQVREELDGVAAALETVAGVARAPVMREAWRAGRPSLGQRQGAATERLAGLREGVRDALRLPDLDALQTLEGEARAAREVATELRREAQARFDAVRGEAEARLEALREVVGTANRDLRFVIGLGVDSPRLNEARGALEAAIAAADGVELATPATRVEELSDAIKRELSGLRRAARQPPDDLRSIAELVLTAHYQEALDRLGTATFADPRAVGHACLLRAVATFGRDATASAGREGARAALEQCQGEGQPPKLVESAFPPAFVELYREVELAAAAPADAP